VVQRHTADVDLELREAPDDVHDTAWLGIRRQRLGEAIARLPDDQRRALELAFLGGLTHVEVAEREGIPLGTAKTRIRTALLKLREDLAPTIGPDRPPAPSASGHREAIQSSDRSGGFATASIRRAPTIELEAESSRLSAAPEDRPHGGLADG
jgi:hypothetical protein